jgi:hypothetical protein
MKNTINLSLAFSLDATTTSHHLPMPGNSKNTRSHHLLSPIRQSPTMNLISQEAAASNPS